MDETDWIAEGNLLGDVDTADTSDWNESASATPSATTTTVIASMPVESASGGLMIPVPGC